MSGHAIQFVASLFLILFSAGWNAAQTATEPQAPAEQQAPAVPGQEIDKSPLKGMTADDVVRRFTVKEKQWKQVREQYTFEQSVKIQALEGEEVRQEYRQVAEISYQSGKRLKKVLLGPQPTLDMSPQDIDDIETRSSFTIS